MPTGHNGCPHAALCAMKQPVLIISSWKSGMSKTSDLSGSEHSMIAGTKHAVLGFSSLS